MSQLYTDFDLSMKLNANGDLIPMTDEGCIRQVISNSVKLNTFDIPFNNWYAADISKYLFDNPNKIMESEITKSITDVLLMDPRLKDPEIKISYSSDYQFMVVDITVYVVILDKVVSETIQLDRAR